MKHNEEYKRELRAYVIGLIAAFVLTVLPFAIVAWAGWSTAAMLWIIGLFALVQTVVHFRYFLHIDLTRQKREDLHLILFSALLLIIMSAGTIWIMGNLQMRMMHG